MITTVSKLNPINDLYACAAVKPEYKYPACGTIRATIEPLRGFTVAFDNIVSISLPSALGFAV
jgi:hypothetical protein